MIRERGGGMISPINLFKDRNIRMQIIDTRGCRCYEIFIKSQS